MNPAKDAVSKGRIRKKKAGKRKKYMPMKFNKEKFLWTWGIGIVCSVIGILIIGATKTAPDSIPKSLVFNTPQRLSQIFPETTIGTFEFILGNLLLLFGVICIFLGLKLVVKYISGMLKN